MPEQIEVVYENGVFRPVAALPHPFSENQRLTVTIEGPSDAARWLADADPAVSLEAVRLALGKTSDTLARLVHAERDDR